MKAKPIFMRTNKERKPVAVKGSKGGKMKANSQKEQAYAALRAFGTDRLNNIVNRRIRTGYNLEGLTKAEREYCVIVLHASAHASELTPDERAIYHKARAVYSAMLARRNAS